MHDLAPITALGAVSPRQDRIGAILLTECPDIALISIAARRGNAATCARLIAEWLGQDAPDIAQCAKFGDKGAFWIAPDTWMLEAPLAAHENMAKDWADRTQGAASVTEQTDAWVRFDLSGNGLPDMLARLTNLDLATLPEHFARRTVMDHIGTYLLRHGAGYSVYAPRSFAGSLHHALMQAAQSVSAS